MVMRSRYTPRPNHARLIPVSGGLALEASYDSDLTRDMKSRIPAESRRWDPDRKRWLIDAQYGDLVAKLATAYLGVTVTVPALSTTPKTETRLLRLEYLGRTKDRNGTGDSSAFGWDGMGWTLVFPESVLREWFEAVPQAPGEKPTLYAVLGIKQTATPEEIKSAHRRMARQWHPDVNRSDPDAAEQFKIIQHAYEVLSVVLSRKKYDAGLAFQASIQQRTQTELAAGWSDIQTSGYDYDGNLTYRAPLKCGWILCEGTESVGRFVVSKLIHWEDIQNEHGQVMVSSWPMGAKAPEIMWQ